MSIYRPLGRTGVQVSSLCLGTANFGDVTAEDEAGRIIAQALDAGINLIDTADFYGSGEAERIIGAALKATGRRDQIILTSKVHFPMGPGPNERGNSRLHIMRAIEDSLRRLQTDHIDLYFIHRPDFAIPQDETLRALDDLARQGKVRYIGLSTFPAWLVMEAIAISRERGYLQPVCEQSPYNLADRRIENELLPLCQRYGLGMLAWSPLAGGILAGRYPPGEPPAPDSRMQRGLDYYNARVSMGARTMASQLVAIAGRHGLTAAQLALLWVKDQPGVTSAVLGPRLASHLDDLLPMMERSLDPEIADEINQISHPGTAVANFLNNSGWMKMQIPD